MSYVPLDDGRRKDPHVENIELTTTNDGQSHSTSVPPPGLPSNMDTRYSNNRIPLFPDKAVINDWPVNSQRVAAITPLRGSILVFDVLLASTPFLFTILAIVVAKLDNETPLPAHAKLQEMLLYTPTVFPLLFAALMGRFFRHLGVWLAERGTTLGRLEQLIGCQSVFLAIERQISLRNFSVVGLCSILIWLLSPFGGQSALRVLRQETRYINSTQTLSYLDPLNIGNSYMMGASAINSGRSTFTPIFLAALLSSADYQIKSADIWGNIKLPSYRAIENTTGEDWKVVSDYNNSSVKWGSLIGIPVSAFNGEDFTTRAMNQFSIRARQFSIDCTSNAEVSRDDITNETWPITSPWRMQTAVHQPNCTDSSPCILKGCNAYPCPFISMSISDADGGAETASMAECEYYYDHIEAYIDCNGSVCKATSMRKLDMLIDGYTEDSDTFLRSVVMTNLMVSLPSVDTIGVADARARGSTNMERWLMDPSSFIGAGGDSVNLYTLPPDLFAERLTILWNTFFQATYATRALAGYLDTATSSNITDAVAGQTTFNTTENLVSQREVIYRVNWRWFSVLFTCSLVLLCAAYAGLVLKYLSIAPDIVGYASSLTLLNPYVPTPTGGTTLHGLERTALLHDLPVRLGDVCPNEPVGAIALAANDGRVVRLNRRRWYI